MEHWVSLGPATEADKRTLPHWGIVLERKGNRIMGFTVSQLIDELRKARGYNPDAPVMVDGFAITGVELEHADEAHDHLVEKADVATGERSYDTDGDQHFGALVLTLGDYDYTEPEVGVITVGDHGGIPGEPVIETGEPQESNTPPAVEGSTSSF